MKVKVQILNDEEKEVMPKKHKYYDNLKYAYYKYHYNSNIYQNRATMYSILEEMAENHQDELIQIWNEIRDIGVLHFDEDDPLYLSTDIFDRWIVYNDIYEVIKIEDGTVYFRLVKEK